MDKMTEHEKLLADLIITAFERIDASRDHLNALTLFVANGSSVTEAELQHLRDLVAQSESAFEQQSAAVAELKTLLPHL